MDDSTGITYLLDCTPLGDGVSNDIQLEPGTAPGYLKDTFTSVFKGIAEKEPKRACWVWKHEAIPSLFLLCKSNKDSMQAMLVTTVGLEKALLCLHSSNRHNHIIMFSDPVHRSNGHHKIPLSERYEPDDVVGTLIAESDSAQFFPGLHRWQFRYHDRMLSFVALHVDRETPRVLSRSLVVLGTSEDYDLYTPMCHTPLKDTEDTNCELGTDCLYSMKGTDTVLRSWNGSFVAASRFNIASFMMHKLWKHERHLENVFDGNPHSIPCKYIHEEPLQPKHIIVQRATERYHAVIYNERLTADRMPLKGTFEHSTVDRHWLHPVYIMHHHVDAVVAFLSIFVRYHSTGRYRTPDIELPLLPPECQLHILSWVHIVDMGRSPHSTGYAETHLLDRVHAADLAQGFTVPPSSLL